MLKIKRIKMSFPMAPGDCRQPIEERFMTWDKTIPIESIYTEPHKDD